MIQQKPKLQKRWQASNTCVMCGMPFVSVGRIGPVSQTMQEFQSLFKERYPRSPGLFDVPQDCHMYHRKDWDIWTDGDDFKYRHADPRTNPNLIPANQTPQQFWFQNRFLHIDSILEQLKSRMVNDLNYMYSYPFNAVSRERMNLDDDVRSRKLHELYQITVAGCKRCNDLMTMQKPTSRILIACQILNKDYLKRTRMVRSARLILERQVVEDGEDEHDDLLLYADGDDDGNGSQANAAQPAAPAPRAGPNLAGMSPADLDRLANENLKTAEWAPKQAFKQLITNSVERAFQKFQFFSRQELTLIMQAFVYVMAANLTCERIEVDDIKAHDKFRVDGMQKLYTSFFFYVLNVVRHPGMFLDIPLETWHVAYMESRTLNLAVSFNRSVFGDTRFVPNYTKDGYLDYRDFAVYVMARTRQGLLRALYKPSRAINHFPASDNRELMRSFNLPSVWQIAWMALGADVMEKRVTNEDEMSPEHRRYFPVPSYANFQYAELFNITELNIDHWVLRLGRRMIFRRMLAAAQFSMDRIFCDRLHFVLKLVTPAGDDMDRLSVHLRNYIKYVTEMTIEIHKKCSMLVSHGESSNDYEELQRYGIDNTWNPPIDVLNELADDYYMQSEIVRRFLPDYKERINFNDQDDDFEYRQYDPNGQPPPPPHGGGGPGGPPHGGGGGGAPPPPPPPPPPGGGFPPNGGFPGGPPPPQPPPNGGFPGGQPPPQPPPNGGFPGGQPPPQPPPNGAQPGPGGYPGGYHPAPRAGPIPSNPSHGLYNSPPPPPGQAPPPLDPSGDGVGGMDMDLDSQDTTDQGGSSSSQAMEDLREMQEFYRTFGHLTDEEKIRKLLERQDARNNRPINAKPLRRSDRTRFPNSRYSN